MKKIKIEEILKLCDICGIKYENNSDSNHTVITKDGNVINFDDFDFEQYFLKIKGDK